MKKRIVVLILAALAAGIALARAVPHRAQSRSRAATHSLYRPSSLDLKAPEVYDVKVVTTNGSFRIRVHRDWAPLGADRFYNLARFGFYNGDSFFRVLPGFVVQFGISPNPRISKVWEKATLRDDPVKVSNRRGTVTFATGGPNTRTTQVFINLADNARLDARGFSPFGEVVAGMATVVSLYAGYGEGAPMGNGPDQGRLQKEGQAYLERYFPRLDHIISATVERAPRPAPERTP